MKSKKRGQQGEKLAKKLLINKGYKFLSQNYFTNFGEIDLIFQHHQTIVFVEVKARTSLAQGLPQEAVTPRKLRTITKVAQHYLITHHLEDRLGRIDVVSVDYSQTPPHITHLENVTG